MKGKLIIDMEAGPTAPDELCEITTIRGKQSRVLRAGTEIDHPDCYKLVHGGFAEAADDECRERVAQMNETQEGALRKVHERLMREQEDFQDELTAEQEDDEE